MVEELLGDIKILRFGNTTKLVHFGFIDPLCAITLALPSGKTAKSFPYQKETIKVICEMFFKSSNGSRLKYF